MTEDVKKNDQLRDETPNRCEIRSASNDFNDLNRPCCVRVALDPIFRGFYEEKMIDFIHAPAIVGLIFLPLILLTE
jgi:hypothetical protein